VAKDFSESSDSQRWDASDRKLKKTNKMVGTSPKGADKRVAPNRVEPIPHLTPRRIAHMLLVAARTAECLEMPTAVALVKGCLGGRLFPLNTTLRDIFPDPDARNQFCQCVADGAAVARSAIPCSEGTTLAEVIDAIAC
jgi:hypothetical protein